MPLNQTTIASQLQPFVDNHTLAGAVTLVASEDEVLSLEAVGWADIAAQKPMTTDAMFWIASQTKPMTATALMMLVDEGKVQLNDPVEKYLPEFKDQWLIVEQDADHRLLKRPKHPITVRNILSHTSGLPFSSPLEQPTLDGLPIRDYVRSYAMLPLEYEPDTEYRYSNEGINTAGRIIEVVSDMPYDYFMETRLFNPLDMDDTTFWPDRKQLELLAKSYKPNPENTGLEETTISQLRYPLSDDSRGPMPGGGLFSTATDVCHFCQMILQKGEYFGEYDGEDYYERLLSEAAVIEMTRRQTGPSIQESYGLGWAVESQGFGHGGALSTNMTILPQEGLIMIFLVQHAGYPGADGDKIYPAFRNAANAFANQK